MTHQHPSSEAEEHVLSLLRQIEYGKVEVILHDSRIVQVEKSEKKRFTYPSHNKED